MAEAIESSKRENWRYKQNNHHRSGNRPRNRGINGVVSMRERCLAAVLCRLEMASANRYQRLVSISWPRSGK